MVRSSIADGALRAGAVLVRLPADHRWAEVLPAAPGPVTVTVGHPDLLGDDAAALERALDPRGYRIVGVASAARPIGAVVDLLVPRELRESHPAWWAALGRDAERIFDLDLGPVRLVLAAELALHERALA